MSPRTAHSRRPTLLALALLLALAGLGGCTTLLQRPAVIAEPERAFSPGSSPLAERHLALGNPSGAVADERYADNYLIVRDQYALSYSRARGTPNWVSWHLERGDLGPVDRYEGQFITDGALPAGWRPATHDDYTGSGYDRGHLTPSADRTDSAANNEATFILTNILPQAPENNRGPWKALEDETRDLVESEREEAYIVAGGWGSRGTLAGGSLTIPEATWKVLVFIPEGAGDDVARITEDTFTIAIWMPNDSSVAGQAWDAFETTIACIEQRTGLDLLSAVPDAIEAALAGSDCDGRTPRGSTPAAPAGAPTPAAATVYALTIAEIQADPPGEDAAGEYVALRNDGSAPLDLHGWTLADAAGATYTFPPFTLAPGASVRVWVTSGADDAQNLYWGASRAIWNNDGDTATVADAGGYLWAELAYP